jgi:hypothetical protein
LPHLSFLAPSEQEYASPSAYSQGRENNGFTAAYDLVGICEKLRKNLMVLSSLAMQCVKAVTEDIRLVSFQEEEGRTREDGSAQQ